MAFCDVMTCLRLFCCSSRRPWWPADLQGAGWGRGKHGQGQQIRKSKEEKREKRKRRRRRKTSFVL